MEARLRKQGCFPKFYLFEREGKERGREGEAQEEIELLYLLVHSSNATKSQGKACSKLGAGNSIQISHIGGRHLEPSPAASRVYASRKQEAEAKLGLKPRPWDRRCAHLNL